MATKIKFTALPVGTGSDDLSEANVAEMLSVLLGQNFVQSGFAVPASSVDLTLSVALGKAFIAGFLVDIDSATTVTCIANNTNHIYLQLDKDGSGNVTGASFHVDQDGSAPTDSVKIATAVAGAASISSTTDARPITPWLNIIAQGILQSLVAAGTTPVQMANHASNPTDAVYGIGIVNGEMVINVNGTVKPMIDKAQAIALIAALS